VSSRPDYPSGRCPRVHASCDVYSLRDGKLLDPFYQRNDIELLVLSAHVVSVDDDF